MPKKTGACGCPATGGVSGGACTDGLRGLLSVVVVVGHLHLVEVLLLHRRMEPAQIEAGMRAAVRLGNPSPDMVAVEARAAAGSPVPGPVPLILPRRTGRGDGADLAQVTVLPTDPRPLPAVDRYDSLLDLDQTTSAGGER